MAWVQMLDPDRLLLFLLVQPRSSRNRIAGLHGDMLKICLTAPPVDNKANKAVVRFLSGVLKLPRSAVRITAGQTSRRKQVLLNGIGEQKLRQRLQAAGVTLEA